MSNSNKETTGPINIKPASSIQSVIPSSSPAHQDANTTELLKLPVKTPGLPEASASAIVMFLTKPPSVNTNYEFQFSNTTAPTPGMSSFTTSSIQFLAVNKVLESSQKSMDEFIKRSEITLRSAETSFKTNIKELLLRVENEIKTALINQHTKAFNSKSNIQTLLEVDRLDPQKRAKRLQMTSYLKSLSRLKHIAEDIVNERIHYHQFLKKFSNKIITEDPSAFECFHESVVVHLNKFISDLALERMSCGMSNQLSCLEQLRISFTPNLNVNDETNLDDNNGPAQDLNDKLKAGRKIEDVRTYQARAISSITSLFASQLANLTEEFHAFLFHLAKNNERIYDSQIKDYHKVLDEIEGFYVPLVKVESFVSVYPDGGERDCRDLSHVDFKNSAAHAGQRVHVNDVKPQINHNRLTEVDETMIKNLLSSLKSGSDKCYKNITKLIDLWDKRLSFLFDKQLSSHRKEAINNLKNIQLVSSSVSKFLIFDTRKLETFKNNCITDIKQEQKKILSTLNTSIKSITSCPETHPGTHRPNPNNLTNEETSSPNLPNHISNIQIQHRRATKLMCKWFTEFFEYYERTWKEYKNLIGQNRRHLNLKQLRDQKFIGAQLIVQNFSEEVHLALNISEEMVYELSERFNLQTKDFLVVVKDSGSKIKDYMTLFKKHMKDALAEFKIFINSCSKHVDDFYDQRTEIIRNTLSQGISSIKDFSIAQNLLLHPPSVITSNNDRLKLDGNSDQDPKHLKFQSTVTEASMSKQGKVASPIQVLPESSSPQLLSKSVCRGSSKHDEDEDMLNTPFPGYVDLSTWKTDPKNFEFIDRYINASRMEIDVPKWAEIDVTSSPVSLVTTSRFQVYKLP